MIVARLRILSEPVSEAACSEEILLLTQLRYPRVMEWKPRRISQLKFHNELIGWLAFEPPVTSGGDYGRPAKFRRRSLRRSKKGSRDDTLHSPAAWMSKHERSPSPDGGRGRSRSRTNSRTVSPSHTSDVTFFAPSIAPRQRHHFGADLPPNEIHEFERLLAHMEAGDADLQRLKAERHALEEQLPQHRHEMQDKYDRAVSMYEYRAQEIRTKAEEDIPA